MFWGGSVSGFAYLWLAGNAGVKKRMERATLLGMV